MFNRTRLLFAPLAAGLLIAGAWPAGAGFGRHYELFQTEHPAEMRPSALAAGDFNGDGRLDLVSAYSDIVLLPGGRGGGFEEPRVQETPFYRFREVHSLDVNGDGVDDLLAVGGERSAGTDSPVLVRLEGRHSGNFVVTAESPFPWYFYTSLAWGDFDGDGAPDALVEGSQDTLHLMRGIPDGGWESPVAFSFPGRRYSSIAGVADVDADGRDDVLLDVGTDSLFVLRGSADSGLGPLEFLVAARFVGGSLLAARDLNGDGRPELWFRDSGRLHLFESEGNSSWRLVTTFPTGGIESNVLVHELTGDGQPDMAYADRSGFLTVYPGEGGTVFGPPVRIPAPYNSRRLSVGPWGSGGAEALVMVTPFGGLAILPTPLESPAQERVILPLASGLTHLAVQDLDDDGQSEVLAFHHGPGIGGTLLILPGLGGRGFGPALEMPLGVPPEVVVLSDLDGDGRSDLLVQPYRRRSLWFYRGTASPPYFQAMGPIGELPASFGDRSVQLAVGDISGDGRVDIIALGESSRIAVLPGLGGGLFGPPRERSFPGTLSGMALADIDPEPGLELLVLGYSPGILTSLRLNASGNWTTLREQDALSRAEGPLVGLIDGDCLPDVLLFPSSDRTAAMFSRGDGSFEAPLSDRLGRAMDRLQLVDLNGDGREDLVGVNRGAGLILCRYGRADGVFGEDEEYSVGGFNVSGTFADVDTDGFPDFLWGESDGVVRIAWNDTEGGPGPEAPVPPGAPLVVQSVSPNPGRGRVHIEFAGVRRGDPFRFDIFDVQGRRVAGERGLMDDDRELCRFWDGETTGGAAAPPGVYFVRLESAGRTATARIVRIP